MKNKLLLLFLFFLPIFHAEAGNKEKPFVVVIDPGHGGHDSGTTGYSSKEKNIVLSVSKLLGSYISERHPEVKVVYTRKSDVFVELDDRANIANKAKADLFISVHINSVRNNKKPRGAETYTFGLARTEENLEVAKRENSAILLEEDYEERYEGFNPNSSESYIIFEYMQNKFVDQSVEFASLVQNELVGTAKRYDRGVRQSSFLVLRKASMPRVLIELDFLSNPNSATYLKSRSGQETMARSISNAFDKYFKKYNNGYTGTYRTTEPKEDLPDNTVNEIPETKRTSTNTTVTSPKGIVYKVQILASVKKLPKNSPDLKGYKADFYYEKGWYKYTYGESSSLEEISKIHKSLLKKFKNSFIVTFKDGKKIANK